MRGNNYCFAARLRYYNRRQCRFGNRAMSQDEMEHEYSCSVMHATPLAASGRHSSVRTKYCRKAVFSAVIRPDGFTLVELVIVMIVIAVLAFVALPRLSLLNGYDEIGYADRVKATIQFARKAAVAQRRTVTVTIDASDVTLAIQPNVPEVAATATVGLVLPTSDRSCGGATNKVCHPNGVTLTPAGAIVFDAQGRATAGFGIYTVAGTTSTTPFTVESDTGYVH